jgi:trimeric autotransporter adhesin
MTLTSTVDSIIGKVNTATSHIASSSNPHSVTKAQVGLSNVDNTSDANKPVSSATQTALNLKANQSTTYTKIEVDSAISGLVDSAPLTLNTLNELAAALGDDANFATTVTNNIATKAPLNSPTFTGTVSGVTKTMVGLGSVDNTADTAKNVLSATKLTTARTIT